MKIYIDQNVNQRKIRELKRFFEFKIVQNDLEQPIKPATIINKAFTIGVSTIGGPDIIAGDNINLAQQVIGRKNWQDIGHIYSAHINDCDYFITENVKDFINNGRKELLEKEFYPLKIRRLIEFIKETLKN